MRDALRYQQKKIGGKSGDSGDEMLTDEVSYDDGDMKNALAFLTPTASKFPRQTTVLGGDTETPTTSFTHARTSTKTITDEDSPKFPPDFADDASNSTVYSYVSKNVKF